jgi:hypothetical protein
MYNNIWGQLPADEGCVGDSHFNHPRILHTRFPAHDDIDVLCNNTISSIRAEIDRTIGRVKNRFRALTRPWRSGIETHHCAWAMAIHLTALMMKDAPQRHDVNQVLYMWQ